VSNLCLVVCLADKLSFPLLFYIAFVLGVENMTTAYDVPAEAIIKKLAEKLKNSGQSGLRQESIEKGSPKIQTGGISGQLQC